MYLSAFFNLNMHGRLTVVPLLPFYFQMYGPTQHHRRLARLFPILL